MSAVENEVEESASSAGTNVETVSMGDGRTVDFVGKRKLIRTPFFKDEAETELDYVRFDFRNGQSIKYAPSPELFARFAAHGVAQKLGDETAGLTDVDDMVLAVEKLVERLDAGGPEAWRTVRESSGLAGTSILLRALVILSERNGKPKTAAEVKEFLSTKSPQEKLALRNSAKLKPIIEELEAAKNAKAAKVDTEALLESFA